MSRILSLHARRRGPSVARHPVLSMLCLAALLGSGAGYAQRDNTQQAFDRFEEDLQPEVDEGTLSPKGIGPIILVGATSAYEETRAWFPAAAVRSLVRVFGRSNIRACEACMNPTVRSVGRRLEYNTVLSLADVVRIDEEQRGKSPPARSAVWMEETPGGMAVRIVSLANGQILFAGNFDGSQTERVRTAEVYNLTTELGRRLRGQSLTHVIIDAGVLPNLHISTDVVEQFGDYNLNLAGLTFSLIDPVVGFGVSYYRVIPQLWDFTIGAKLIASIPTVLALALNQGNPVEVIDPPLTGVIVARFPIPQTNFAAFASASTNFSFTVGVSMLNVSLLPFLP